MAACGISSSLVSSVLSTRSLAAATASRATSAACAAFLPAHKSSANVRSIEHAGRQSEVVGSRFFGQTSFGSRQTTFHGAALAPKAIHGSARTVMTIKVGDEIPDATLSYFDSENNMQVNFLPFSRIRRFELSSMNNAHFASHFSDNPN